MSSGSSALKAIFWDNDGVLVDTEQLYFRATKDVLASVGVELTEEQYIELLLVQGRGAWHLAEERGIAADEIDRLRHRRNALYAECLARAPLVVAGVESVLAELHGRYVMGIVTTCSPDHFEVIHRSSGLLKYFDFVLLPGDYGRHKPHPDPYQRAIERSGFASGACVAIEDSERGLASATAAGLRCFVVRTPLTRGRTFAGALRILDSVTDIPSALTHA
jgi:HAD superfamily hydrolase (TIGR01509 family)